VWTLTGTATFSGDVNVNGGTLLVNGSLASASVVFVSPGATLGGTGVLAETILDDGATLAPGTPTAIGTLTVNTLLLFCACSLYSVKVSGLSADKTQVNGDVFLNDAPVVATVTGSSIAKRYTILTASGGLTDTFGTLTGNNTPAGFTPSLSYDANNVYLNYQFTPVLPGGLNGNQQSVAGAATTGAVNIFNAGGAIPVAFGALTPAMLTQMSGEVATGSQQTTFDAMTQFMALMTDPFTAGRGFEAPGAIGFAEGDATHAYAATSPNRTGSECEAYGMITRAAPAPAFDARWSVWAAGFGGRPDHRWQRGARIEHGHESSRCGRRRPGLLVLAADHRRLCAGRWWHEFQRCQ
jgi:autotransporter-associated beta strand protein